MTRASEARAHAVFRHVFPDATVIEVIPNRSNMTETIDTALPEDTAWAEATAAPQTASYPETPVNPHNHAFTLSLVPDKAPFLVIRASSTQELLGTMDALEADGVYAAMGAAQAAFRAHAEQGRGPAPTAPVAAPQAPAQGFQAPAPHAFQGNQPPPFGPNVSVPGAPGFVGAPAQQFAPAPPAAQAWGAPQAPAGGRAPAQPKQCPAGWFKTDKNGGPGSDHWKAWREANQAALKGKISWGGASTFWVAPDVAQMVHDQGFIVLPA
jgi:hypothetical protein